MKTPQMCMAAIDSAPLEVLSHVLTYRGLVEFLADVEDRPQTVLDLPPLEHAQLATILESISEAVFLDALAESGTLCGVLASLLLDAKATQLERSQLVGVAVIEALKDFLLPLLLRVVQARWDLAHEAEGCENPFPVAS